MELILIKSQQILLPGTDEAAEWLGKKKQGATIRAELQEMRNGAFFRKWWALVKYAFDQWSETCEPEQYKGMPVQPDFDRFRKDVTILAGFRTATWNIKGELRVEAESLKWANMSEERFAQLYEATLRALTQAVFNGKRCRRYTPQQLADIHEYIWSFADQRMAA